MEAKRFLKNAIDNKLGSKYKDSVSEIIEPIHKQISPPNRCTKFCGICIVTQVKNLNLRTFRQ